MAKKKSKGKGKAAQAAGDTDGNVWVSTNKKMPALVSPDMVRIPLTKRKGFRLHKEAKKQGKRHSIDIAESNAFSQKGRIRQDITMPDEKDIDAGWSPGPPKEGLEPFTGPATGIQDPSLNAESNAYLFMQTQITEKDKKKIGKYSYLAMIKHHEELTRKGKKLTSVHRAIDPETVKQHPEIFDLWLVARIRTAQMPISIPQKALWDPTSPHYNVELNARFPYYCYICYNKYVQFAVQVEDPDTKEPYEEPVCENLEPAQDQQDEEQLQKTAANGQVKISKGLLVYVCCANETLIDVSRELEVDVEMLLKDNVAGIPGLTKTAKLRKNTELCVGLMLEHKDPEEEEEEDQIEEVLLDGEDPAYGKIVSDRLRKRRELEADITSNWPKAFKPHEHLSWDEMVREHKHWHCSRFKFKPNVHSGSLVDAVTCCRTYYVLAIEEQGTALDQLNDVGSRAKRLFKNAGVLDNWYCVHVDRGYSKGSLGVTLRDMKIHSNMCIQDNRVMMPRKAMALASQQMLASNLKWQWCVWNKGPWSCVVWNDGKVVSFVSDYFKGIFFIMDYLFVLLLWIYI